MFHCFWKNLLGDPSSLPRTANLLEILGSVTVSVSIVYSLTISTTKLFLFTVEPRYNNPWYNDIPGVTINMLCPVKSYSKMYGTEPRYNNLWYNDIHDITMSFSAPNVKSSSIYRYYSISTQIPWVSNYKCNCACNFKSGSRFALVRFWNYLRDYSLNCTPLSPVTITI